ncbi:class I SAM-dependent DNA methyltransferase [Bacillus paranthracis]|uniref:class I SAM-dependent DNA methyltransferase n=1 Tax=Bacillus paranthracis TaxID=2026186 RepID=UPI00217FFD23|nr:DNA methyltransferase [Bacillus paranthracis]
MLDWKEIRSRAMSFTNEWKDETNENAEAKSFWNDFFNVFGITRKRVATFEERVKKLDGKDGYIDLLWKGVLLIEHKSRGKNLERAYKQAKDYFPGLKEAELPKYILVSDFARFALYDLETGNKRTFTIEQFHQNIELFGFIAGYHQKHEFKEQDPVNIEAAEKMGKLHDQLKEVGYIGHELEVYLVRLLFCLFADDTGIFEKNIFRDYIEQNTKEDGSDLAYHLDAIFDTLNKSKEVRLKTLSDSLNQFPYVNGKLFEERLSLAAFNTEMRDLFLECCALNWGKISPAIFGSMFQSVMKPDERRELGAHYTSEQNIMKVIQPLFLDELRKEFESVKGSKKKLEIFHEKIANLKFFDPACGCGNFLIIAYRELRLLEMDVLRELTKGQMALHLEFLLKVNVEQFYGIEIDEFPAQIAQVALWLIDHQMNMQASYEFGQYFVRIPLTSKPNIVNDNALRINWESVVSKHELSYILGNPPFIGARFMSDVQKKDLQSVREGFQGINDLDFVSGWFLKAADYTGGTKIKTAFVSTNSIVQGGQAAILWKYIFNIRGHHIHFAHQTFKWTNEARGKAAVYCVIVGFAQDKPSNATIYTYPDISGDPVATKAENINQYLVDALKIFISKRTGPLSAKEKMIYGSIPADGKISLFSEEEKNEFVAKEPLAEKYFRPYVGGYELINSIQRYCLYLKDCPPAELRKMPLVLEVVKEVAEYRKGKKRYVKLADYPTLFGEDRVVNEDFLGIPVVSSENRKIIPIAYYTKEYISSNQLFQVPNATPYLFGILNSSMHMAWTKVIGGRLKGDYRYSNSLIYNNFIFPEPTEQQVKAIEKQANNILQIRSKYVENNSTLADLYDPLIMPVDLRKAHEKLDSEVDKAYQFKKQIRTDEVRVEFLFDLYEKYTTNNK